MKNEQLIDLVNEMTLEEKVDQLLQLAADFYTSQAEEKTGPMEDLAINEQTIKNAGSVLGMAGAKEAIRVQNDYMANHRLNIPTMFMADIVHGFKTIFPIPLGIGSSWSMEAAEKMAEISAKEAAVSGVHITFSPMVDLVRDPRWGRVMESTGEDTLLNSRFAQAIVKGYQGTDLKNDPLRVAACVKHFAAYGAALAGRDYNTVDMSELVLRENYLGAYHAALEAGAKLVMTAFNTIEGIPATGNQALMRGILRDEFQFDGVLISDWGAVKELIPHGVAKDEKQAAQLALEAGVDIEMMTSCYSHSLAALIEENKVDIKLLDEAVLRVLNLKNDLGLFENPHRGADETKEAIILSSEHRKAAREVAEKSIVLLKNNDEILPLHSEEVVALIGPAAHSKDILGEWSWQGEQDEAINLVEGSKHYCDKLLVGTEEFDYFDPSEKAVAEALSLAKQADKVVLALGEPGWMSGEAASVSDIRLPKMQRKLVEKVAAVNPNLVVTLYNGRPLDLRALESAKGIVEAWFPGTEGGNALASILWGRTNPSGRLSMSFPENIGQVPIFYNCHSTGRPAESTPDPKYHSKYLDVSNDARYPFGYGLSYSTFEYQSVTCDQTNFTPDQTIQVVTEIVNQSDQAGVETVQLYIRDKVGEVVRPVKELKDFQQVRFQPGEKKKVIFTVKEEMLRYTHKDLTVTSDAGAFEIMVGPNSRDVKKVDITLIK